MITVNMRLWQAASDKLKKRVRGRANEVVRLAALTVVKEAMRVSPQWSGNYAINWQLQFGPMAGSAYQTTFKVEPFYKLRPNQKHLGHPDAINLGMARETELVQGLKWNHKLRLVNLAPVAPLLANGEVKLRPENLVAGGVVVSEHLKSKFRGLS